MHVADGALMRWLDEDCDTVERRDVARHLEICSACRARLAEWRQRADLVRAALRRLDVSAPSTPKRARWPVRAAAAVILLAAFGATVSPVRAWLVERVTSLWTAVAGPAGAPSPDATPQVPPAPMPSRTTVTFRPATEVFMMEIAAWQAEGELVIESGGGETATATIEGGDGSEQLVVLPTGLRLVNASDGRASYRIRLPSLVRTVHVLIADASPIRFRIPSAGTRRALPLQPHSQNVTEGGPANR